MLVQSESKTYTLDEYRTLEEKAEFKSEYDDGNILPMSGGTIEHNNIIINLIVRLLQEYRGDEKEIVLESVGVYFVTKNVYEGVNLKIERQ